MKTRGRPRYPDTLTPRQQEVLALVQQGLTNEEIAQRLGITLDGSKFHVSEILSRLGVTSRHEAAEWRPEPARPAWALAPFALLNKIKWSTTMTIAAGAATAAAAIAIGVLTWGVLHTDSGDGTAADGAPTPSSQAVRDLQGNPKLAPFFAAIASRDVDALLDQVNWQAIACGGKTPQCPPGVAPSTVVQAVSVGTDSSVAREGARPPLVATLRGLESSPAFIAQSQSQPGVYLIGYNARTNTTVPSAFGDPSTTIAGVIFHVDATRDRPIDTLELTSTPWDTAVTGVQRVLDARGDLHTLLIAGAPTDATADPGTQPTSLYQNHFYGVELRLPSNWVPESDVAGVPYDEVSNGFISPAGRSGGYLQIDGISAPSLDYAVDANAHHLLKPFGDNPVIADVGLFAGDGKLILPDPRSDAIKDAALILPYPELVRGTNKRYPLPYLALYSDATNIMRIAESLQFVDPASIPQPSSPPGGVSAPAATPG